MHKQSKIIIKILLFISNSFINDKEVSRSQWQFGHGTKMCKSEEVWNLKKFVIGKDSKGAATLCRQTLWKEKVYSKEIKWLDIGNGQYILVIC